MVKHRTNPNHHCANGLAVSAVKTAKNLVQRAKSGHTDLSLTLRTHRYTPTAGMTATPVQRLMGCRTQGLFPIPTELLPPPGKPGRDKNPVSIEKLPGTRWIQLLKPGDTAFARPRKLGDRGRKAK